MIFTSTEIQTTVKPEVSSQIASQTLFQTSLKPPSTQFSQPTTTMVRTDATAESSKNIVNQSNSFKNLSDLDLQVLT